MARTNAAAAAEDARRIRVGTAIAFRAAVVVVLVGLAAWWIYLVRDVLVLGFGAVVLALVGIKLLF